MRANAFFLVGLFSIVALSSLAEESPSIIKPIVVNVLVLNFDPLMPPRQQRLHETDGWNNPHRLAEEYIADMKTAVFNLIQYRIFEWRDLDVFPVKADGFAYTAESYSRCMKDNRGWHEPDAVDYPKLLKDHGVIEMIDSGKADELWIFGAPYFGYNESAMAGPGAFFINGATLNEVPAKRPFAIMGYNYERGVAEMLHNLCHRVESTMARIYGDWKVERLETLWEKFSADAFQSGGYAGVGNCHFPPNAESGYDYENQRKVLSSAEDWLNYPRLTGKKQWMNCETWGGPDYHRNYMKWWFAHLPHAPGKAQDGRLHNWWEYVFNFDRYGEKGMSKG